MQTEGLLASDAPRRPRPSRRQRARGRPPRLRDPPGGAASATRRACRRTGGGRPRNLSRRLRSERWEVLLGIRPLGTTFWRGLSNHQAATAQMHLVEKIIVECRPLLGALPPSLTDGTAGARSFPRRGRRAGQGVEGDPAGKRATWGDQASPRVPRNVSPLPIRGFQRIGCPRQNRTERPPGANAASA